MSVEGSPLFPRRPRHPEPCLTPCRIAFLKCGLCHALRKPDRRLSLKAFHRAGERRLWAYMVFPRRGVPSNPKGWWKLAGGDTPPERSSPNPSRPGRGAGKIVPPSPAPRDLTPPLLPGWKPGWWGERPREPGVLAMGVEEARREFLVDAAEVLQRVENRGCRRAQRLQSEAGSQFTSAARAFSNPARVCGPWPHARRRAPRLQRHSNRRRLLSRNPGRLIVRRERQREDLQGGAAVVRSTEMSVHDFMTRAVSSGWGPAGRQIPFRNDLASYVQ